MIWPTPCSLRSAGYVVHRGMYHWTAMLVVLICGIPGAGKSTLASILPSSLTNAHLISFDDYTPEKSLWSMFLPHSHFVLTLSKLRRWNNFSRRTSFCHIWIPIYSFFRTSSFFPLPGWFILLEKYAKRHLQNMSWSSSIHGIHPRRHSVITCTGKDPTSTFLDADFKWSDICISLFRNAP